MRAIALLALTLSLALGSPAQAESPCLDIGQLVLDVNAWLGEHGADYSLVDLQPMLAPSADQRVSSRGGGTYHSIKAPFYEFVPNDPRRPDALGHPRDNITVGFDRADLYPPDGPEGEDRSDRRAATLQLLRDSLALYGDEPCAEGLVLSPLDELEPDLGVLQAYWSQGASGSLTSWSDIAFAGFLPHTFFDATINAHPWCGHILGLTATFAFRDPMTGAGTDLDHDGRVDVKFRESYLRIDADWSRFDVFTVALHEAGHLLGSQDYGLVMGDDGALPSKSDFGDDDYVVYHGIHDALEDVERSNFCKVWRRWPEDWLPLAVNP